MSYLNVTPENGKWYISEGFKASRGQPTTNGTAELVKHNLGATKMILAGPFDTREQADSQLQQYSTFHNPSVWLCNLE